MQVTAIVYHAHCLDGLCAAAIAKIEFPHARCIAASYSTPIPQFEDGDGVLMVDFCYPPETLKQVSPTVSVMILDHHESSRLALAAHPDAVLVSAATPEANREVYRLAPNVAAAFSLDQSGAEFTWSFLHPKEPMPMAVRWVGDRDMWRWKLPDTDAFTIAAYDRCQNVEDWYDLIHCDEDCGPLLEHGKTLLAQRDVNVAEQAARATPWEVPGLPEARGWYVKDCEGFLSETGAKVLKDMGGGVVALERFSTERNRYEVSLRSDGSVDCSVLAGRFGGGGHVRAAGYVLPTSA